MKDVASISVIVPVYNVEKYVRACIESLLKQTISDYEIILVDDGSPDSSGSICDEYKQVENVTVIHQQNQGVSVARNHGIEVASGKWITFVDGDDFVEPDFCETAVRRAEENQADVVIFSYWTDDENGSKESRFIDLPFGDITAKKEYLQAKTISQYYGGTRLNNGVSAGTTWGKVIRHKLITDNDLRFPKGIIRAQDTVFWLYGFEYAQKIVYTEDCLYHYRVSGDNITSSTRFIRDSEEKFYHVIDEYKKFLKKHHKENTILADALNIRMVQVMMWVVNHEICNPKCDYTYAEKVRVFKKLSQREDNIQAIKAVDRTVLINPMRLVILFAERHMYALFIPAYELMKKYIAIKYR